MDEHNYAISLVKANVVSLLLFIPLSALYLVPYATVWSWNKVVSDFTLIYHDFLFFLFLMVVGVLVHELLHGLTWRIMGNKSWSALKFGFNWTALAPYAHCREPLEVNAYRWGAAIPGVILGVFPFLIGIITGDGWFTLFGFIFTVTASGDILILWLIRKIEPGTMVQDHPELAGCEVIYPGDLDTAEDSGLE